jgi:polyhydroxyalkanoate synthesis regulator phasin
MARRRSTPKDVSDAVREAVERTVQAGAGSAERGRDRAQGALDDVVDRVREAEASITKSRRAVAGAVEDRLPATQGDISELKAELRRIGRRLEAIEERLPKRRSGSSQKRSRSSSS